MNSAEKPVRANSDQIEAVLFLVRRHARAELFDPEPELLGQNNSIWLKLLWCGSFGQTYME